MIVFDFIFITLSLIIGFNFKNRFKIFNDYDKSLLNKLFVYHIFFSILFFTIITVQGGDATNYWFKTFEYQYFDFNDVIEMINSRTATGSMLLINYLPAKILQISFFTGNIIYGVLGYMGFVYFYVVIKKNIPRLYELKNSKLFQLPIFPIILFLPNLHFWSSGIGKDTLLFFCIALFIYSLSNSRKKIWGLIISILLSIAVRPHITLFLLVAIGVGYAMDGKLKVYQKALILVIFTIGFMSIFQYVLIFLRLENFEAQTITDYTSKHSTNLSSGAGSAVDISGYSYPLKIFTFLYRPLFFDSSGLLGLQSSIENLVLLFFSIKILLNRPLIAFRKANSILKGTLIFFFLGAASFSLVLGNLGIMIREKMPFIMALIIFGLWTIALNKFEKEK